MPTMITLVNGTVPVAEDFNGNFTALNNAIGSGTSISAWATGEIPYASAANTLARLSPGSAGQVLTMGASIPAWGNVTVTDQLTGLGLANNAGDATNDIDVALGAAASEDAAIADRVLMSLVTGLTKRLDANWVVGTNQGMLDTGSIANAVYHIFLIQRPDTGVVDVLASTSATAPTMPTSYTKKRRIGSIIRSGGAILAFIQHKDRFLLVTPVNQYTSQAIATGAGGTTLTLGVPTGLDGLVALVNAIQDTTTSTIYFRHPDQADLAGSPTAAPIGQLGGVSTGQNAGQIALSVDESAQVIARASNAVNLWLSTQGWIDVRGRG